MFSKHCNTISWNKSEDETSGCPLSGRLYQLGVIPVNVGWWEKCWILHMTFVILNSPCQAGLSSSATFATESTFIFVFDAMKLKSRRLLMSPTISTINSSHLMIGAGLPGAFKAAPSLVLRLIKCVAFTAPIPKVKDFIHKVEECWDTPSIFTHHTPQYRNTSATWLLMLI